MQKNKLFIPPETHTYVCVSKGTKCSFFGKFGVFCFLGASILGFTSLPTNYSELNFFQFNCLPPYLNKFDKVKSSIVYYEYILLDFWMKFQNKVFLGEYWNARKTWLSWQNWTKSKCDKKQNFLIYMSATS